MNEVCKGLGFGFCVRQQLEGFGFGFGGAPQVLITKRSNTLSIQASPRIAKLRPMQTLNLVTNINPVKARFSSGDELSICTDVLGNTKMPVLAGNNPRKCSQLRHALRHHERLHVKPVRNKRHQIETRNSKRGHTSRENF